MVRTYGKDDEIITLDELSAIGLPKNSELDDLHRAINQRLTFACQLKASTTPDALVNIGAISQALVDGRTQRFSPLKGQLQTFVGGTIDVSTGATTGAIASFTFPTASGVSQYVTMGIALDVSGTINVNFNTPSGTPGGDGITPFPKTMLGIGYVKLESQGAGTAWKGEGAISNVVENNDITQFLGAGGGAGGSGDVTKQLLRFEMLLASTDYRSVEPNIIAVDEDVKIDPSTTGTFNRANDTYSFTVGQFLQSLSLLDSGTIGDKEDITKAMVSLIFDINTLDTAPVVELSRNGGGEWQPVNMTRDYSNTDTFTGEIVFSQEVTKQVLEEYAQAGNADGVQVLNATTQIGLSQEVVTSLDEVFEEIEIYVSKTGTPTGLMYINLHEDNAGDPGAVLSQKIVNIATLVSPITFGVGNQVTVAGEKYHISFSTDASYKTSFSSGIHEIAVESDNSTPAISVGKFYNGSVWAGLAGASLVYKISGRKRDLLIKYTAGGTANVVAYGVFFGHINQSVQKQRKRNVFLFNGTTNDQYIFPLSFGATADIDALMVQDGGQIYMSPNFELVNGSVVFPSDFFTGRADVYLRIFQIEGGSYDNNDMNRKVIVDNHLGSADVNADNSIAGRGVLIRNEAGVLVELSLDASNNIILTER